MNWQLCCHFSLCFLLDLLFSTFHSLNWVGMRPYVPSNSIQYKSCINIVHRNARETLPMTFSYQDHHAESWIPASTHSHNGIHTSTESPVVDATPPTVNYKQWHSCCLHDKQIVNYPSTMHEQTNGPTGHEQSTKSQLHKPQPSLTCQVAWVGLHFFSDDEISHTAVQRITSLHQTLAMRQCFPFSIPDFAWNVVLLCAQVSNSFTIQRLLSVCLYTLTWQLKT